MSNPISLDDLTECQREGLGNVTVESLARVHHDTQAGGKSEGWVKSRDLSGTAEERSSKNLKSLVALGLLESQRFGGSRQSQYRWRPTELAITIYLEEARQTEERIYRNFHDGNYRHYSSYVRQFYEGGLDGTLDEPTHYSPSMNAVPHGAWRAGRDRRLELEADGPKF